MNAPKSLTSRSFRLGQLLVNPDTGMISGPFAGVHLEPRVMMVLETLTRAPGQLVTRGDLLDTLWSGAEVYDEALTQCVYQLRVQLRKAGGETCGDFVKTVPKRGYMLDGDVEPVPLSATNEQARPEPSPKGRLSIALGSVAFLFALGLMALGGRPGENPAPAPAAETVAVLPFLPLVEGDRHPELEVGMADTLITHLSTAEGVVVRPISSVRRFGDLARDALLAGRQLGADAVVDGSVQRDGDRLRVSVRLLRVDDGKALWADTMSAPVGDIFAVQDEISGRIAASLSLELGQGKPRTSGGTSNTAAYEQFLLGRYHLGRLTPTDLRISVERFRQAVAIDPDYTQAWLGLAAVQFRIPIAGEAPPLEFYPLARQAAERALELDPASAEAHAMLGWIEHWYGWDWRASEAHFRRAIELDPADTESQLGYAHLLSNSSRHEEAIQAVRRAREISPFYPVAAALEGQFLLRAGRPQEAIQQLEASRAIGEGFWLHHMSLALAYMADDRAEDALAQALRAREVSSSTWAMANCIGMLVALERDADAQTMMDELQALADVRYVPPYDLAVAHHAVENADTALRMLELGYELRDPKMIFLGIDRWPLLRDRPAFKQLVERMGLWDRSDGR